MPEQRLPDQVRRPAARRTGAEVDARLAKPRRLELPVAIGDMQEADVAKGPQRIVQVLAVGPVDGAARIDRQSGNRRGDEPLQEFAPLHDRVRRRSADSRAATVSLVDRGSGVHQQRGDVLDLLLRKYAVVAEPRHRGAGGESLGIEDLAVSVALGLDPIAAQFAEADKARPDGAIGDLLRRELVARVAVASDRPRRIVRVLLAAPLLRYLFAVFPIAEQ